MSWKNLYDAEIDQVIEYIEVNNIIGKKREEILKNFEFSCQQRYQQEMTRQDHINKNINVKEFTKLEKSAKSISKTTKLDKEWQQMFDRRSHYNEQAGKNLLYSYLSSLITNNKIKKGGGRKSNIKLHCTWLQDSRCLSPKTKIVTKEYNKIKIEKLPSFFHVLSYNFIYGNYEWKPAIKFYSNKQMLYCMTLENDTDIICSEEHKFFRYNPKTKKTIRRSLKKLKIDDYIYVSDGNESIKPCKIKSIEQRSEQPTYDLKVADNYNFFLANGILSHNSGKDEGMDFISEVDNLVSKKLKLKRELYNFSGTESPEVLLNYYKFDHTKKAFINKHVKGLLSSSDLLISRECSFLFRNSSPTSRQSKQEILLQAMEGREVPNRLKMYDDLPTINTQMKGVFIGVSRPVDEVKDSLLNSGLMQRTLFCVRQIDPKIRDKMTDIAASYCFPTGNNKKFHQDLEKLADSIVNFVNFFNATNFKFNNPEKLNSIISTKIKSYNNLINEKFKNNVHKKIITSFIGGFMNQSMMIAHINAGIRRDSLIKPEDVLNAFELLEKNLHSMMYWIEEVIQESVSLERRKEKNIKLFKTIFKGKAFLTRKQIVLALQQNLNKSEQYCYNIIRNYSGTLLQPINNNNYQLITVNNK